jgi:hypothetical protein
MCDECGTVYDHEFINDDAPGLQLLHDDGWVRYEDWDLCQECKVGVT